MGWLTAAFHDIESICTYLFAPNKIRSGGIDETQFIYIDATGKDAWVSGRGGVKTPLG